MLCFEREMEEQEQKRKRTVSEREEEDDGTLVGPLPVEHSADDMQAAKKVKREI